MALPKAHAINACRWSRGGGIAWRRAHAVREAVRDSVGGGFHRVPRKVRVAGGRLDLADFGHLQSCGVVSPHVV